jgi:hypothetical protein
VTDPSNSGDGEIDFAGSGLAANAHAYFSLEGVVTAATLAVHLGHLPSFTITPSFGTTFNGIVAKLQPSGGAGNLSQETAAINWGEGSITQAMISTPAGNPAELDVAGTHTYWSPGRLPIVITLTNAQTGGTQTFNGFAVVSSRHAGLGDSYSSAEGAGWPPGQLHPDLPGCDWQLYQDPSGVLYKGSTDHIDGAQPTFLPPFSSNACATGPPPNVGNTCHRATTAYAHVVDRLLAIEGITLDFVACSGAVVQDAYSAPGIVHNDQTHTGEFPQVGSLGPDVSLITLTFGGNNLGFASIAANCAKGTLPPPLGTGPNDTFDCIKQDNGILDLLGYDTSAGSPHDGDFKPRRAVGVQQEGAVGLSLRTLVNTTDNLVSHDLHDALVLLYRDLKAQAPGARILVLGYPRFFPAGGTGNDCEHFTSFDQPWVNERIALADQVIQDAAFESGVAQYVDVYNALHNHEECTGDSNFSVDPSTFVVAPCTGRWINGIDVPAAALGTAENLHPNPCGHQAEGQAAAAAYNAPSTADNFALSPGQSHTTQVNVPAGPGIDRVNFTSNWLSGTLNFTLTDPSGTTYTPVQRGPVYATWDIPHPPAGLWTLATTNVTVGDLGAVRGSVTVAYDAIPFLPPAGQIILAGDSCGLIGCTATFQAVVNPSARSEVASYDWFDDQAHQLTNTSGSGHDTVRVDSLINRYRVILRTNGKDGEVRYTAVCSDGKSVTLC